MAKRKQDGPFDLDLSDTARTGLAHQLCQDVDDALMVRSDVIAQGGVIDLIDWFYEQGRSAAEDRPFPGAADLTSYFITENVDALRARLMRAVFSVEPFCTVDGWGPDADKVSAVEEFHEWQIHEEGLPAILGQYAHQALLEDCAILEVRERIETRKTVETFDAVLELNDAGGPIFETDARGKPRPKLKRDAAGDPIRAQAHEAAATVEQTATKTRRLGPECDVISMRDFVFLPGHAKNARQVYGYAYRFWQRVPEIEEKAKDGIYDATAVARLGTQSDREAAAVPTPAAVSSIAPQTGPSVEKELFALSIKRDLDGDGREEWYVATISLAHRELLRLKLDTFVMAVGMPRCVPFVPYPRRDSVYGYSYAGDKLLTLAEEHTALRNMKADRGALATNAPMTLVSGALWDPDAEPLGVGRVIHVRDHNEVKQLQIADVPNSIIEQERALVNAKERVGGLSDMSIGVQAAASRTLGENQMVSMGSDIRVEEALGHFRASIAQIMKLRHAIWVETLKADAKGVDAPASVTDALSVRGQALTDGRFTVAQLAGRFRFKAYGSVETADSHFRQQSFNQALLSLGNLAQIFPGLRAIFENPDVVKAVLDEWCRVNKVRNRLPFLKALQAVRGTLPAAAGNAAPAPMIPGAGGAPPGGPAGGTPDLQALLTRLTGGAPPMPMGGPSGPAH
jgi:hypothetical protein